MFANVLLRRTIKDALTAALPVVAVGLLRMATGNPAGDSAAWLWSEAVWWLAATAAAAVVMGAVSYVIHSRQFRAADRLIDACQKAALDRPADPAPLNPRWDIVDRLNLSIQIMHQALNDRLDLYQRFFEDAPDMLLTFTSSGGRITEANGSFCRALGRLPGEVISRQVDDLVTLEVAWNRIVERPDELVIGVIHTDKGDRKVEASVSLGSDPGDQLWVIGMILRDIEQREALHDELLFKSTELEKALQEVQSVEELKDQLLTTLSHELKTPLVSLKGFLQLIMSGRADEEQQTEYLDICARNLDKLEKQINNLLDLARLTHAKDQYEMEAVDLALIVRTETENLKPLAAERKVTLDLDGVDSQPAMVMGTPERLVQLVDNLVMNAVKYNVEAGVVRISITPEDHNQVLTVTDSGVGMDRQEMVKAFNYFYRAEKGGTGRLEGLGIGLSLVQEIVRLHKGDIELQSDPGIGTTFTVRLAAA